MDKIIGAVVIIYKDLPDKRRRYLLLQHKNTLWTFVGGRIEKTDASVEAGLQREIYEELGLSSSDYQLKNTYVMNEFIYGNEKPDRAGKNGVTFYYSGNLITANEPKCHAEIIQIGWFDKDEILAHLAFDDIKSKFLEVLKTI